MSTLRDEVRILAGHFIENPESLLPYITYLLSHMNFIYMPNPIDPLIASTMDLNPIPEFYNLNHNSSIVYKFDSGCSVLKDTYTENEVSGTPEDQGYSLRFIHHMKAQVQWKDLFVVAYYKGHKCKIPYYSSYMVPSGGRIWIQPLKPIPPEAVAGFMDSLYPNFEMKISSLFSSISKILNDITQSPTPTPTPYTIPHTALQLLFQNYLDIFSLLHSSGVSHEWFTISSTVWRYRWNFHFPDRIPKPRASVPGYNWKKYFFRTVRETLEERVLIALKQQQERENEAYWSRMACSCGKTCQNALEGASLRALRDDCGGFLDDQLHIKVMDMLLPTLCVLDFMKKINRKPEFSELPVLENSLYRYLQFLELCFQNPDEELIPTMDIDVCWQAHLIRTKKYRNFCYEKFGRSIDRRIFIEEQERLKKLEKTEYLWKKTYGEEYHVPLSQLSKLRKNFKNYKKSPYMVTPEEIIKDRDWLDILHSQYVKPIDFDSVTFLVAAIGQYEKFLEITAKFPQETDGPGPTHPVDLVWHCHQMHPQVYERDCMKLMKKLFDHDPWPHERLSPEEFEQLRLSDRQVWRDEFKQEQWVWT